MLNVDDVVVIGDLNLEEDPYCSGMVTDIGKIGLVVSKNLAHAGVELQNDNYSYTLWFNPKDLIKIGKL